MALSRRALLYSLTALARAEVGHFPSDLKRFRDPATEFEIFRYTDPAAYSSILLPTHLRSMSSRNNLLLFCSDRPGSPQLFRMDTKSGDMRQLTSYEGGVQPGGAALLPDDRAAVCMYGDSVDLIPLGAGKTRTLYTAGGGAKPQALAVTHDGGACLILERSGASSIVRQLGVLKKSDVVLVEEKAEIAGLRPRPRSGDLLYRKDNRLRLFDAETRRIADLATAAVRQALWSGDGKSILYITMSEERGRPVQLRELLPESGDDRLLANTSQYVNFARNADASVFAGVCGNKGSPHILLLLRVAHRELTVSEHRASVPAGVVVLFSPDSQRIFYHTDRQGRSCIYAVPAEKLVERTDT